ncbi:MAG: hypothetical protein ACE5F6_00870 [Anaerolineae bacterium]
MESWTSSAALTTGLVGIGEYRFMTSSRAVHAQSRAEQIGQDERKAMATW